MSLPPVPVPNTEAQGALVGMASVSRWQRFFFSIRDWINTAWGEGTALVIALLVAGLLAAVSLIQGGIHRYIFYAVVLLMVLWLATVVGLGIWALIEGRTMLR